MHALDIMTIDVITAGPTMSVQELARLLDENAISAVPVVDAENRPIGMVSEGDLLHRLEMGAERPITRRRSWWLSLFGSSKPSEDIREYIKSHGRTVGDVMTRQVISVGERTTLADIATLLETRRIKRVPVVRDGKLVGIVSRANLIRAMAALGSPETAGDVDDHSIREKMLAELKRLRLSNIIHPSDIIVRNRVIHLWELDNLSSPEERQALRIAAESVSGVLGVEEHLVPASVVPGWYSPP
jgi:CBS domain-containing protein